ncbi:50S ribosomal protein L17 [Candidatus Peregrinibacteria bacterium]|nr:MAG: 50S ribosomal protein L17 [Candidatus Peregrinibacteria bacterium]
MRHKVKSKRLNRPREQLKALMRSLAISAVLYENIETTRDKAKMLRSFVDRLISRAKRKDKVSAIRYLQKHINNKDASLKIMETLVPRFKERDSGFSRFINTRICQGNAAQLVLFQILPE